MLSTIKLDGELEQLFDEIKHRLADQLGSEPTNDEVIGMLMDEYASNTPNSSPEVRGEQTPAMED